MIKNAVKVLNELLALDPGAINEFFRLNVIVNISVCNHPTVQVYGSKEQSPIFGTLRPLGLINGLFQKDNKVIIMIMDDLETKIIRFAVGNIEDGKVKIM